MEQSRIYNHSIYKSSKPWWIILSTLGSIATHIDTVFCIDITIDKHICRVTGARYYISRKSFIAESQLHNLLVPGGHESLHSSP